MSRTQHLFDTLSNSRNDTQSSITSNVPLFSVQIIAILIIPIAAIIPILPALHWRGRLLRSTNYLSYLNVLSGSILVGFGVLHLLPDAVDEFEPYAEDVKRFPMIPVLFLTGFFLMMAIEKGVHLLSTNKQMPRGYVYVHARGGGGNWHGSGHDHQVYHQHNQGPSHLASQISATPFLQSTSDIAMDCTIDGSCELKDVSSTRSSNTTTDVNPEFVTEPTTMDEKSSRNIDVSVESTASPISRTPNPNQANYQHIESATSSSPSFDSTLLNVSRFADPSDTEHASTSVSISTHTHVLPASLPGVKLVLLTLCLSLHSVFEGLSLGLSTSLGAVTSLFLGITLHKLVEGFVLGMNFVKNQYNKRQMITVTCIFAVMPSSGLILGLILRSSISGAASSLCASVLNGISSGVFLYVSVWGILMEELNHGDRTDILKLGIAWIGAIVMATWRVIEAE